MKNWCLRLFLLLSFMGFLFFQKMNAQCMPPFGTSFTSKSTNSVEFRWTDPNNSPLGWDVEIVEKGMATTGVPHNTSPILSNQYMITGLNPSTFYEIYIRTLCSISQKSSWNGPFVVSTVLVNPTSCGIHLDIKDNGTETFLMEVNEAGKLGQDVFIESVDVIVEHEWPADLMISLVNPSGKSVKLTRYHGTGGKNLGNPDDLLCFQSTQFTDQACTPFQESSPSFNGLFKPAEPLSGLHDFSEAKGIWKLVFHDRAAFHRGKLQFAQLKLSTENCILPTNFFISEINNNSVLVDWESVPSCQSIKITIKEVGKPADQERVFFLNCLDETFRIPNLNPETSYEIFYQSVCGTNLSASSCLQLFKTTCKPTTLSESFDTQEKCLPSCQFSCAMEGLWQNDEENIQNWTVWTKETDTENTGPASDLSGEGHYIYVESQPGLCGTKPVILMSSCLRVMSNGDGCDAAFHYHMSGSGIGTLSLEVSRNGGTSWEKIWQKTGHQGNTWQRALISLDDYTNEIVLLRFVAIPTPSIYGDIALDLIEFYGSHLMSGQFTYYRDEDNDSFGSPEDSIVICQSVPPTGYVSLAGDCHDRDANIYPGADEITCNLIDENCNGDIDDRNPNSDLSYQFQVVNESCKGQKNGSINLLISGGVPPYSVTWNTGATSPTLSAIGEGIYICTISDATSCSIQSELIPVFSQQQLQIIATNTIKPSCSGLADGAIFINHSGGQSPYSYQWSNGGFTKDLTNISEGHYQLTLTDINGCQAISAPFSLTSNPGINAGPVRIKHPSCFESKNGEIELGVINGVSPFVFSWDNGHNQALLDQVGSGIYYCTVSDARGCQSLVHIELTAPDTLETVILTIEPVRCHGEKNGIIKTNTTGGTQPYLYFWSHGSFADDIFDLGAGKYSLTVTDRNGCRSLLKEVEVPQPLPLESSVTDVISARCILGENGKIELLSTGGSPPYHYSWSYSNAPDSSVLENVRFGVYSVIVFDALGCKFSLGSILLPFINVSLPVDVKVLEKNKCFGENNGKIEATVALGNQPYDFNWSSGFQHVISSSNDTLDGLPSGGYSVTVTDREGCVGASNEIEIPMVPAMTFQVTDRIQNICRDDSDGEFALQIQHNQGPVNVIWNTGDTGLHLKQLLNGFYSAEIIDSAGCIMLVPPIEMTSISNLQLDTLLEHAESGKNNGKICILVDGAFGSYAIQWGEGITTSSGNCATQLAAGVYHATVTDMAGCSEVVEFTIHSLVNANETALEIPIFYPNPVVDYLQYPSTLEKSTVQIRDMQGRILYSKPGDTSDKNIPVFDFPPGLYLIEYSYRGKYYFQKFVKL